ncbi:MAG: type II secretion system GspH family protein [Planctomycetota bacterium]|nr:type II secretion system GspH family protein [Planctomycetota bacterium]
MRAAARFRPRRPRGFTLVESLVALSIALLLVLTGYAMYRGATGSYRRAEDERRFLAAIRSATDGLSRDLQSIVAKAAYRPDGVFKPLDGGMLRLQWPHAPGAFNHLESDEPRYAAFQDGRCRYLGFYVSGDRKGAERVEYYFNPGEPPELRFNGMDDDGDEPAGGTGFLIDEAGALMVRRAREDDLDYPAYAEAFPPVPLRCGTARRDSPGSPGTPAASPAGTTAWSWPTVSAT